MQRRDGCRGVRELVHDERPRGAELEEEQQQCVPYDALEGRLEHAASLARTTSFCSVSAARNRRFMAYRSLVEMKWKDLNQGSFIFRRGKYCRQMSLFSRHH
uniref:Uncharacterized protein n=1 Tax=Zea mays TaxID=4577 RepID=C0PMR2_MAIZE|nr:unknown [Zea mays]|eukprot:NP_001266381.1 uncharacterized protein LOC101202712 [Zea mays]